MIEIANDNASTMGTDTNSVEIIKKMRSSTGINQKCKIRGGL